MYDVFISYPHTHQEWVEKVAEELEHRQIVVFLDRWRLVPGEEWQPALAKGLDEAKTCAVFYGGETPSGWVRQELQKALNRQANDKSFRVIPVLMPGADESNVRNFVELRTWVSFEDDRERALHELTCGIRGEAPGRRRRREDPGADRLKRQLDLLASHRHDLLPEVHRNLQTELMREALANV